MRLELHLPFDHIELIQMNKTEKRRMLEDIRKKSIKLYIADVMSTKDVEIISRMCEKYQRKLRGA